MIGRTLSHYRVLEKLGEGGMGVLYRARDTRLDRDVALKVLRPETFGDAGRRRRLVEEAKAASALNHPHIVTVHDVGQASLGGREVDFIAMECVAGRGLNRLLAERRLGVGEALDVALQITEALAAAHDAGIVHRDVKPANVMISDSGQVKLLDFGVALVADRHDTGVAGSTAADTLSTEPTLPATRPGALTGTPAYMSPEQAEARRADARSDIFALGTVLYEMVSGRRPFQGSSQTSLLEAIVRDSPPPLRSVRPEVPRCVERIVDRCLAKRPEDRYASAGELLLELTSCRQRVVASGSGWRAVVRQPRFAVPLALAACAVLSLSTWAWVRGAHARWARNVALPEIARLEDGGEYYQAYWLARQAAPHLPGDRQLGRFWKERCFRVSLRTRPSGADVFVKDYGDPGGEWTLVGRTPLEGVRMPWGQLRWRITKDGFEPLEASSDPSGMSRSLDFTLDATGTVPPGMVRIGGGRFQYRDHPPVVLDDFWLDRYEVTNRQYEEFVDQGGYRKREYWKQPFVRGGRHLPESEAMADFVDATGRPGPATWEGGSYPDGQGELPVGGVSWFEAAAYAEFAGKELPTLHHWFKALGPDRVNLRADIVHLSNFLGRGPVAVGALRGMSPYGTFDMAGNVREWCWTESRGQRYALGGSWADPAHVYLGDDATIAPWSRAPVNGFRCARSMAPLAPDLQAAVPRPTRDYSTEKAVSDQAIGVYRRFYDYTRGALEATVESVEETDDWRREKVSFAAAYGNERVPAQFFTPRHAKPPYQVVVYSPSGEARMLESSDDMRTWLFDYVVRSGRAVLCPVYQGTYERRLQKPIAGPGGLRDWATQTVQDLRRSLDYLESRPDVDRTRLAVLGTSDTLSLMATALDDRVKVAVAHGGGLGPERPPPEVDLFNFAPRVKVPVLMLAGRYDPFYDDDRRRLLLRLLGTPDEDKRLVFVETGHAVMRSREAVRETLAWLDRYLGPVDTLER